MKKIIELSVHGLVDYLLRRGSIDNRIYNNSSMAEGSRIHLRYQSIQDGSYQSEVYLEGQIQVEDYTFILNGRADGIINKPNKVIIDEIKSTVDDLEHFYNEQSEWHLGQAKCYALLYLMSHPELHEIFIRLTYISQKDDSKLIKEFSYIFSELEKDVKGYIEEYLVFYKILINHQDRLKETADKLSFPFSSFREGQRDMAKYVYSVSMNEGTLFIEAPTGIGKTISTLFPSIKTFAKEKNEKIFYLCAKNSQKDIAFNTMEMLVRQGLDAKVIKITAKDKMCRVDSRKCNPDECPFTINYYDKLRRVMMESLVGNSLIDENVINDYADENQMCPFELQLDLSLFCDVIICDYNYVFDPLTYLKRYFDDNKKTKYMALIDEAHNLVDRSRDMYSCDLTLSDFAALRVSFKHFKIPKFKRLTKKIINYFIEIQNNVEDYIPKEDDFDDAFYNLLYNYFKESQGILKNYPEFTNDNFLDVFRKVNRFLKIHEYVNPSFKCFYEKTKDDVIAHIFCLSSKDLIRATLQKLRAAVFFSATLTPLDYYITTLGGDDLTPSISLKSPFDPKNLLVLIRTDISTKLRNRAYSYQSIADSIKALVSQKEGNYLIFFSSYAYLQEVVKLFENTNFDILIQEKDMKAIERDKFLSEFKENPSKTTLGFAVLGGAFSEGIDLANDKLIGAVIVGVGLPTISYERDLIKKYYDNNQVNGYDYAYTNPGMNKVMQASGRVIRTPNDKGIILLIDERYGHSHYKSMFRQEWSNNYRVYSKEDIKEMANKFWLKHSS